jgi:hypothetical protein
MRAAASSIASGMPSSARTICATTGALDVRERVIGSHDARSVDEELHRLRPGRRLAFARYAHRHDLVNALAHDAETLAGRHEEMRCGRVVEPLPEEPRDGGRHLLAVVEHEEHPAAGA